MNEQELAAELGGPGAQELLRTGSLARLAYNGSDGHPIVVPTGFLWDRGRVYCCTATTAAKVKAIARRPEAALTIDSDDGASRSLLLRGRAGIEVVDGIAPEYLAAAAKSWSGAELAAFAENVRRMYPQMARIAITPAWARFYDFGGRAAARFPAAAGGRQPARFLSLVTSGDRVYTESAQGSPRATWPRAS